jgi:poly(A) polymerase
MAKDDLRETGKRDADISSERAKAALRSAISVSRGLGTTRAQTLSPEDMRVMVREDPRQTRAELDEILCGSHPDLALEEMRRLNAVGFLEYVHPMFGFGGGSQGHKDLWEHTKKVVLQSEPRPVIRWSALFHDVGKVRTFAREGSKVSFHGHESLGSRMFLQFASKSLMFSGEEAARISDVILFLGRVEAFEGEWTDSAVRRLMVDVGDRLEDVIALSSADITTGRDSKRQAILRSIGRLVERVEEIRKEASTPRLPKGLGTALVERLGFPQDRSLREAMLRLESMLKTGEIRAGSTVDDIVMMAREKGVVPKG